MKSEKKQVFNLNADVVNKDSVCFFLQSMKADYSQTKREKLVPSQFPSHKMSHSHANHVQAHERIDEKVMGPRGNIHMLTEGTHEKMIASYSHASTTVSNDKSDLPNSNSQIGFQKFLPDRAWVSNNASGVGSAPATTPEMNVFGRRNYCDEFPVGIWYKTSVTG